MTEQPMPQTGRQDVFTAVFADLEARRQKGIATYRYPLQTFNGRSALRDLYEELLDAAVYCKQALMEQEAQP